MQHLLSWTRHLQTGERAPAVVADITYYALKWRDTKLCRTSWYVVVSVITTCIAFHDDDDFYHSLSMSSSRWRHGKQVRCVHALGTLSCLRDGESSSACLQHPAARLHHLTSRPTAAKRITIPCRSHFLLALMRIRVESVAVITSANRAADYVLGFVSLCVCV